MTKDQELAAAFQLYEQALAVAEAAAHMPTVSKLGLDEEAKRIAAAARVEECFADLVASLIRATGCTEDEARQAIEDDPGATLNALVSAVRQLDSQLRPR